MAFVYHGSDRGAGLAHWCWEHSWQGISSKQSQTNKAASTDTWLNKLNLIESSIITMTEKEIKYGFPNEFLYNYLLFKTCYSRVAVILQDTFNWIFNALWLSLGTQSCGTYFQQAQPLDNAASKAGLLNKPGLSPLWPALATERWHGERLKTGEHQCFQEGIDWIRVTV